MDSFDWLTPTVEMLGYAVSLAFGFWPLILLSPLSNRKNKSALLPALLAAWCALAFMRIVILFVPEPPPFLLIPEPLNTSIFIAAGVVLFAFYFMRRLRKRHQWAQKTGHIRTVDDLIALSPVEFEELVADLYTAAGHRARRTGNTGDHGVDVVVDAKNGEKWVIQCKRWRGTVGEPIIRDFYGVMQHEKAHRGVVITTGKFSRPALKWAKGKPLSLYDGEQLLRLWHRAQAYTRQQQAPQYHHRKSSFWGYCAPNSGVYAIYPNTSLTANWKPGSTSPPSITSSAVSTSGSWAGW